MGKEDNKGQRKDLVDKLHGPLIAWTVLATSLIFTVYASIISSKYLKEKEAARFKFNVEQVTEAVRERIQVYNQSLNCGVALISSSYEVTRDEWKTFVDELHLSENWPGIQGLGYSIPLSRDELPSHIASVKKEGFKDFSVKPEGDRDFYTSIIYLEPFDWRNKRAFGYDMWTNEIRRNAMIRARDTGDISTSGLITLVQETEQDIQKGFLVYKPVYRKNTSLKNTEERREAFVGWVYAAFRTKDFMKGILSSINSPLESLTGLKIYDGTTEKENLMFSSLEHFAGESQKNDSLSKSVSIDAAGRTWVLSFLKHENMNSKEKNIPFYIASAGVAIDVFIFYIIYILSRVKQKTQKDSEQLQKTNEELILSNEARLTSERHLKAIVENTMDGIVTIDQNGKIETFNIACERLLGYKREEVLGQDFSILIPKDYQSQYNEFLKTLIDESSVQNEGIKFEIEALMKNGKTFPANLALSSFKDSQNRFIIGILRDITEHKNAQQAQNVLVEKLMTSNSDLERFAYIASHDLQEPLRMVTNFTQLLELEYSDKLDDTARQYISYSHESALRMQKLVSGLLEYSRVSGRISTKEKVDLNKVIMVAKDNLMKTVKDTDTVIKCSSLPVIDIEITQAIQLFQNLISNSIKYRRKGTTPEINVYSEEKEDSWEIKFCDNGIGIEKKNLEKVFSPFKRLHAYNEIQGTGIGLSLCKKIIENIGGSISIHSVVDHGSIFTIIIPKKQEKKTAKKGTINEKISR